MARDFLPRQDVQIADPSGRTTTPFYVWMQSLERAFGALDVDLAALLEQIEQLKPGQQLAFEGAMSVTVTNVDGTITISLDGDNDSPGGNWYYGTNADGVRGFWPVADGVSGGYSITKAVDYGPYNYQGELDTPDELPYPVVVGDAYLINGDLWVGADDGGDDGAGWDNLGPPPTTTVLSLVNDESMPDPTSYYGTDAAGNKGWHPVSDAVEAAAGELTKAVGGDGVTTFGLPDVTPTPGGTLQRYGFDAKGRRSEEEAADTDDLAEGSANLYFTAARADARITAQKGQPNGLATLDADAKLEANQLPALAITDTFVVNTEAAMLALDAQQGDVAVRTDEQKSYILTADPASTLGNWQELLTPTGTGGTVTSVALSVPTGLTVSGSPITSSGTITVAYDTGYQGYTSAEASKLSGIEAGAQVNAVDSVNGQTGSVSLIASDVGAAPRGAMCFLSSAIPLATGDTLAVPFSDASFDDDGWWSPLAPTRVTVPAGVSRVRIAISAGFSAQNGGNRIAYLSKNGSANFRGRCAQRISPSGGVDYLNASTGIIEVSPGDYFELLLSQNSGSSVDVLGTSAGFYTWIAIESVPSP